MSKSKMNFLFAASLLALFVFASIMAYFSSSDTVTNSFKAKGFDILLTETKWNPKKGEDIVPNEELDKNPEVTNLEETKAYVFLRVTVPSVSGVTVEYRSDQPDVNAKHGEDMPRVSGAMPMFKFVVTTETTDSDGNTVSTNALSDTLTFEQLVHDDCWYLVEYEEKAHEIEYIYAYARPDEDGVMQLTALSQDEKTDKPLFDRIRLINYDEGTYPGEGVSVNVTALGIQTDYLVNGESSSNPEAVWNVLKGVSGGEAGG